MRIKTIILFVVILLFGACSREEEIREDKSTRTVLMYVVASNLESSINLNIDDMMEVATPKNLRGGNLIVYYSKNNQTAELFQIKEGSNGLITKHPIANYTNRSAIDPEVMQDVIYKVATDFPADSYGLIFSSHGTSWLPSDYSSMLKSFGAEAGKNMEIYELAEGIPDAIHFDFILFDVCSMGGIECVYELKDKADYIIASPSEVIATGFPYKTVLPRLFKMPADLEGVARDFYAFYAAYTSPYGNIAVTKTSELDKVARLTQEILSAAGGEKGMFSLPFEELQIMSYLPNCPTKLFDFSDVIKRLATDEQYEQFSLQMDEAIVSKYHTEKVYTTQGRTYPVNKFSGLSVYPPQRNLTQLNEWYKRLQWYKAVYTP